MLDRSSRGGAGPKNGRRAQLAPENPLVNFNPSIALAWDWASNCKIPIGGKNIRYLAEKSDTMGDKVQFRTRESIFLLWADELVFMSETKYGSDNS